MTFPIQILNSALEEKAIYCLFPSLIAVIWVFNEFEAAAFIKALFLSALGLKAFCLLCLTQRGKSEMYY